MRGAAICLLAAVGTGCATPAGSGPMPARLIAPSEACLTQIASFASARTGRKVSLGAAAFAEADRLLLEPVALRGPDGRQLDGLTLRPPVIEAFRLQLAAGLCEVVHEASGTSQPLAGCDCRTLAR